MVKSKDLSKELSKEEQKKFISSIVFNKLRIAIGQISDMKKKLIVEMNAEAAAKSIAVVNATRAKLLVDRSKEFLTANKEEQKVITSQIEEESTKAAADIIAKFFINKEQELSDTIIPEENIKEQIEKAWELIGGSGYSITAFKSSFKRIMRPFELNSTEDGKQFLIDIEEGNFRNGRFRISYEKMTDDEQKLHEDFYKPHGNIIKGGVMTELLNNLVHNIIPEKYDKKRASDEKKAITQENNLKKLKDFENLIKAGYGDIRIAQMREKARTCSSAVEKENIGKSIRDFEEDIKEQRADILLHSLTEFKVSFDNELADLVEKAEAAKLDGWKKSKEIKIRTLRKFTIDEKNLASFIKDEKESFAELSEKDKESKINKIKKIGSLLKIEKIPAVLDFIIKADTIDKKVKAIVEHEYNEITYFENMYANGSKYDRLKSLRLYVKQVDIFHKEDMNNNLEFYNRTKTLKESQKIRKTKKRSKRSIQKEIIAAKVLAAKMDIFNLI